MDGTHKMDFSSSYLHFNGSFNLHLNKIQFGLTFLIQNQIVIIIYNDVHISSFSTDVPDLLVTHDFALENTE